MIQEDAALKKDIKVVGIGVGDSPKRLGAYKTKFRVQFPLVPDQTGETHSALGGPPTPAMIVTTPAGKVLTTHAGVIKDFDAFLQEIRDLHKKQ